MCEIRETCEKSVTGETGGVKPVLSSELGIRN